eukprot:GILK01005588.1.p1 GENE.GILK01005588.1~~GILK01005588.1.p1  ORF type:complete len:311 (+),score=36.59 GILK01005588.1:93-1025(+)
MGCNSSKTLVRAMETPKWAKQEGLIDTPCTSYLSQTLSSSSGSSFEEEKPTSTLEDSFKALDLLYARAGNSLSRDQVFALYTFFRGLCTRVDCSLSQGLSISAWISIFKTCSPSEAFVANLFHVFDTNKDGFVCLDDFLRSISFVWPQGERTGRIQVCFRLCDRNRSNFIEREDLSVVLSDILPRGMFSDAQTAALVTQTFKDADIDGDGKISLKDLTLYAEKDPSFLQRLCVDVELLERALGLQSDLLQPKQKLRAIRTAKHRQGKMEKEGKQRPQASEGAQSRVALFVSRYVTYPAAQADRYPRSQSF